MKNHLVMIKLGGSLIADKTKPRTVKHDAIKKAANEVAKLRDNLDADIIIGTGAGSGHLTAYQYDCVKKAKTESQRLGMSITHTEVRELNSTMATALHDRDIPAFPLSPAGFMTSKNGIPNTFHPEPIKTLLNNRFIPLMHGDTLCDIELGGYIFSTERVFNACLANLRADYKKVTVIYAMDKEGVLGIDGKVMPQMTKNQEVDVLSKLAHDISGGILGKVQGARDSLKFADDVYIVGGKAPGAILKAAQGLQVGTKIL